MSPTIDQTLCAHIAGRDTEAREDLARHVAIPTGKNHTAGLDAYRGIVVERLTALGAVPETFPGEARPGWLLDGEPGEPPPTVVCRRPSGGRATVLIASHLDTVFDPAGSFREMRVSSDGATAIGPGVVDMKGGILVALLALEALESAGVELGWTYLLNADEETGSFSSEGVLRREAGAHELGIATEPALPGGELAIERKGSGQFRIDAIGRSAHAGREFEKGVSAVYALAHALIEIEGLTDLERGVTVNVGLIQGGSATNAVPDLAYAWGNVRYPDPSSASSIGAGLDGVARGGAGEVPRIVVHRSLNRPAKPETPEVRRFAEVAREVAEGLGQSLPFARTGGVCDGNIMQDAGLTTLDTLGVRGGGLHTHEEWIDLSSLVERAQLLACLLARVAHGGVGR